MAFRCLLLHSSSGVKRKCWEACGSAVRGLSASSRLAAIKTLRDKTGAPISDIKASLEAAGFDQEAAFDDLRKRGLLAASKKGSRTAAEGLVGVARGNSCIGVIEVNCETDFVARNEGFCKAVSEAANAMVQIDKSAVGANMEVDMAALEEVKLPGAGVRLKDHIQELAGSMRENIKLRRGYILYGPGELYAYLHNPPPMSIPLLGKIAGLVSLQSQGGELTEAIKTAVDEESLGRRLAMQIVGLKPRYMNRDSIPSEHLEKEKQLLREQALLEKKPEAVIEKIVTGRLSKFYEDHCLMDQRYVVDDSVTVGKVIQSLAKKTGNAGDLSVGGFLRVQCGEGLDPVEVKTFSEEVAQMVGVS